MPLELNSPFRIENQTIAPLRDLITLTAPPDAHGNPQTINIFEGTKQIEDRLVLASVRDGTLAKVRVRNGKHVSTNGEVYLMIQTLPDPAVSEMKWFEEYGKELPVHLPWYRGWVAAADVRTPPKVIIMGRVNANGQTEERVQTWAESFPPENGGKPSWAGKKNMPPDTLESRTEARFISYGWPSLDQEGKLMPQDHPERGQDASKIEFVKICTNLQLGAGGIVLGLHWVRIQDVQWLDKNVTLATDGTSLGPYGKTGPHRIQVAAWTQRRRAEAEEKLARQVVAGQLRLPLRVLTRGVGQAGLAGPA